MQGNASSSDSRSEKFQAIEHKLANSLIALEGVRLTLDYAVRSLLSDLTIAALRAETAKRFPDRLAVVFREQGVRWRWEGIRE